MSTRPRISFDEKGFCSACQWSEKKKNLDWESRISELEVLLAKHRSDSKAFDCLVPVSGGKDGSYVAYNLKHKYGMNPLCVTVTPPLSLPLGDENLRSFVQSGYDHISINPNFNAMQKLNKIGFSDMGFQYYGWLIAIHTAVAHVAANFGISLIFYGEDGEVEYGGSTETSLNPIYDIEYQKRIYLEGGYSKVIQNAQLPRKALGFFEFPEQSNKNVDQIELTHWSYFENWDPYRNYLVAKEHCGLRESDLSNPGTFTNFAQNDQALYSLHAYLMYLKFGFGRANQDACIEVRRGAMERSQAVNLVRLYDGNFPEEFEALYLEYYELNKNEFMEILDKHVNKDLFEKVLDRWTPKFTVS